MMFGQLNGLGEMAFQNYGDWTDRIAKGELPFAKPQRPQGVERGDTGGDGQHSGPGHGAAPNARPEGGPLDTGMATRSVAG